MAYFFLSVDCRRRGHVQVPHGSSANSNTRRIPTRLRDRAGACRSLAWRSVEPLVVVPVVRCAMVMDLFVVLVGHLVV